MTTVAIKLVDIFLLTNEELIRRTEDLAADVRAKTSDLVESLAEMDRRKLYQDFNCVSLFEYCIYKLRMSDAAAYRRIRAARAIQAYPPVGPLLRAGKLTLESLILLHPFLNDVDAGKLVAEASGKRVWEVERLVAGRRTQPPRRDVVRFVAPMAPLEPACDEPLLAHMTHARPSVPALAPLANTTEPAACAAPGVRIAFTADEEFFKLLRQAQAVMRHKYPNGRLDGIFRDALQALLRRKTPGAFGR